MNQVPTQTPRPRRGRVAAVLAASAVIGLAVLIGVRVKETLADRAAVVQTQAKDANAKKEQAAVTVTSPKPATWRPVVLATGSLAPAQEADVGFKLGGKLAKVHVEVGALVKPGQLLANVEASEASAQSQAATAGVRAAEIQLEMAMDQKRRVDKLFETNAISEVEKTTTDQRVKLAEAQLAGARAQARLAGTQVHNATLTAPFAGLITRVPAGIGAIVGPGMPLFHIEDTTTLKLNATLTEGDAHLVQVGDEIEVDGRKGKVTAVLPSLDAMTRRVPMVAEIPNSGPEPLFARAFVRATIAVPREISVLSLPGTARKPGSQDEIVTVENGAAKIKHVVLDTAADGTLFVREGLTEKDVVLVSPSGEMVDGQPLTIATAKPAAAPASSPGAEPTASPTQAP
ncbi:MAG: efflux RND transporter periplasmic adaptor subunit [Polyangiaceae bacterium]|nr:efflux RND transporter periplasmic adaptor subunit [Polyangiaceae bacterium]